MRVVASATVLAYLGVGSNIGNRREQITLAIEMLENEDEISVVSQSRLYVTDPMYVTDQPAFLNGVLAVETTLSADELLEVIQRVENTLGRTRDVPNGPRTIDLDLLLFGAQIIKTESLQVPHPGISSRAFVLVPLCEIAPNLSIPGMNRNVYDILVQLAFPDVTEFVGEESSVEE